MQRSSSAPDLRRPRQRRVAGTPGFTEAQGQRVMSEQQRQTALLEAMRVELANTHRALAEQQRQLWHLSQRQDFMQNQIEQCFVALQRPQPRNQAHHSRARH